MGDLDMNGGDGPVSVTAPTADEMRDAYLKRLGVSADQGPSLALLQQLQRAHVQAIPYENLDVLANEDISLDPVNLFRKIIANHRGGYCFELNVLFGWLLREIGFDVEFRMGRVWLRDPETVPPRNHGTHVVLVDGRKVIADVGFGGRAPRGPLDLSIIGQAIDDGDALHEPLRVIEAGEYGVMIQRRIAGIWSNQFSLESIAAHAADLEVANHFQSTASTSHFQHHLFVGLFRHDGRDGLFDTRLSRRRGNGTVITNLSSVGQLAETLDQVFGIDPKPHRPTLLRIMEAHGCD